MSRKFPGAENPEKTGTGNF